MGKYQLVLSTAPDLETAKKIAEYLIEHKIAACCNLLPAMQSVYSWKGKTETEQEVLLLPELSDSWPSSRGTQVTWRSFVRLLRTQWVLAMTLFY